MGEKYIPLFEPENQQEQPPQDAFSGVPETQEQAEKKERAVDNGVSAPLSERIKDSLRGSRPRRK